MSRPIGGDVTPPRLCFRLPPDPARLLRARQRIRDYLHEYGVEPALVEDVVLAVQEAMSNAMRHSGATDDFEVGLFFEGTDLIAEVKDRGAGFEVESFDSFKRPDPLAPSGCGLYLIARLMDELVLQSNGGLGVRAVKRNALGASQTSMPTKQPDAALPGAQAHRDARQRALLEEIDEAFVALDWEYRFTIVNEAFQRMAGCDRKSLLGHTLWEVFPFLHDHEAGQAVRDAMELGRPAHREYVAPRLDRWIELRAYPTASGIRGFLRDVDERKRKVLAHDESRRRAELLAEAAVALLASDDPRKVVDELCHKVMEHVGCHIFLNYLVDERAGCLQLNAYAGIDEEEAKRIGTLDLGDAVRSCAAQQRRCVVGAYAAHPLVIKEEVVGNLSFGARDRTRFTEDQLSLMKTVADYVALALERERAEAQLRDSRERLELAQAMAHLGSWELELVDDCLTWSDEVYRIFGLQPEEFGATYEAFLERVHPDDRAAVDAAYTGSLRENRDSYAIEHRVVRANTGDIRFVQEHCRHVRDASGRVTRSVGTVHDITERRQAEEALRESERRSKALAQLARIAGSQLDSERILTTVVDAAGEAFGCEACHVALRESEGWRLTRVWNMPEELVGEVFSAEQIPCAELAAREQRPVVVDDHTTSELAGDGACKAFGCKAALAVPLVVQGESMGCLFFTYYSTAHNYTQQEVDFATSVAATVSSALENARLFAAQQRIATTFQENLKHPLPEVPGLELAALSLPASQPELVGGDLHDVFQVADNRVVVLIGDVMGKGIKAAGLTETIRSAVRALALVSGSPAKILRHVNRLLLSANSQQYASALIVVLDLASGRGRLASAGHPPPVVVTHGEAHLLEPRYGPLLGAFDTLYQAREFELDTGATLVLHTDGLTEARRDGQLFGEQRLLETLGAAPDLAPQELVEALRDTVLGYAGTLQDDLEILALRRLA